MSINSYPIGHKFGPYKIILDDNTSKLFSKAIVNRNNENHSPFAIISISFGKLLTEVDLENGAIHLNQSVKWSKKFNNTETIYASPEIVSKTERKKNIFIKIKIEYHSISKIKLGESVSTILINMDGE
jgi:hypothetical protein